MLDGLNQAQREAVETVSGPVVILAGAGTGKTRVISHRAAHAVASGAVEADRILLVTFTEKAAKEMVARVRALGLPAVTARTFHSAALAQLRHFWPSRHDGRPLPEVIADKWRIVAPLARRLPGGYRFTPTKDLIDEIEWAKSRRLAPETYPGALDGRTPPVPVELFVRLYRDYERQKARQGLIDFDDMLTLTVELLESDAAATRQVHGRYGWFSVDEYQDTSPLQDRLLELWLGERRDLCVVGDEDQTIYTFAGATPAYLTGFADRFPDARVIALVENYRSSPQILELANRLVASTGRQKRLVATRGPGPAPIVRSFDSAEAEERAIVDRVRELLRDGVAPREIAVLVRLNAQIPAFEAAFTRAGFAYQVRGQRFFERRDVRAGIDALRRLPDGVAGSALPDAARRLFGERLGFDPDVPAEGAEARERQAALSTLLAIVAETAASGEAGAHESGVQADRDAVLADLASRAEHERQGSADGVELLTLHRAKGLEWDAVFLPALEEGLLPVAQAGDEESAIAEERRLLYVGITRAREHLWLSWARERPTTTGRPGRRTMSRFLRVLQTGGTGPGRGGALGVGPQGVEAGVVAARSVVREDNVDDALFAALKAWRLERAREDGVPPYVVAHDATLLAIAERRPGSPDDLLEVPGIGPARLERYGEQILEVVRATGWAPETTDPH